MPEHFLVAKSLDAANNSAEIDWGWKRLSPQCWRTPAGDKVYYAGTLQMLKGRREDTVVHLGFGWYKNRQLSDLREICRIRGYKIVEEPE